MYKWWVLDNYLVVHSWNYLRVCSADAVGNFETVLAKLAEDPQHPHLVIAGSMHNVLHHGIAILHHVPTLDLSQSASNHAYHQ